MKKMIILGLGLICTLVSCSSEIPFQNLASSVECPFEAFREINIIDSDERFIQEGCEYLGNEQIDFENNVLVLSRSGHYGNTSETRFIVEFINQQDQIVFNAVDTEANLIHEDMIWFTDFYSLIEKKYIGDLPIVWADKQ